MTIEIVRWTIKEGQESAFESAFRKAESYLSKADGHLNHTLSRCLENNRKYMLRVEWTNLEAHTVGFRKSHLYEKYRSLIKPYYEEGAVLEHYENVSAS